MLTLYPLEVILIPNKMYVIILSFQQKCKGDTMNSQKNMYLAFLLNLFFSAFELIGGVLTGSAAILSDAVHDLGDAASIGFACLLEKKSTRPPDDTHTYGYGRYAALGGLLTTLILVAGSVFAIYGAVRRLILPTPIHYNGMLLFAAAGVIVNTAAAVLTCHGGTLNHRAVNLHMLEDVLGWVVILVGAIVMRFTDFTMLDSLLSIGVAVFILVHAVDNLREALDLFLDRAPRGISVTDLRACASGVEGVTHVYHIHLRALNEQTCDATLHVVTDGNPQAVKAELRRRLSELGIHHVTIEVDIASESSANTCPLATVSTGHSYHHHHHHH